MTFRSAPNRLAALAAIGLLAAFQAASAEGAEAGFPAPPRVDAKAIAVIDFAGGDVLYAQDADEAIPPASLTKLMTMQVALNAVQAGRVRLSDLILIRKEEATLPYGSSLMYLQEGMRVPFDDLLRGMAVISGNDAAFAVARVLAGGNEGFAELMNAEAERMGLGVTRFVEPSGLSERNVTTAREMAILARGYIRAHPEALADYHSRYSMEFPRADVMPDGVPPPEARIMLRNRNDLIFKYPGCDGLKTGYIDESGFNLVATAERNGTRFIIVTLGGTYGPSSRERGGAMLLDWAFANWVTVRPSVPEIPRVRVWGAGGSYATPVPGGPVAFTVPTAQSRGITCRVETVPDLKAPLAKGTRLGTLVFASENRVVRRVDLVAAGDIPLGNVFVRLRDAVIRFFVSIFSRKS